LNTASLLWAVTWLAHFETVVLTVFFQPFRVHYIFAHIAAFFPYYKNKAVLVLEYHTVKMYWYVMCQLQV
jgi:hypothetical protein